MVQSLGRETPCPAMTPAGPPLKLWDVGSHGAQQRPCFQMRPRDRLPVWPVWEPLATWALGFMVTLPRWGQSYQEGRQEQQDLPVLESGLLVHRGLQHGRQVAEGCHQWGPLLRPRECPRSKSLEALPSVFRNVHARALNPRGKREQEPQSCGHTMPCLLQHCGN